MDVISKETNVNHAKGTEGAQVKHPKETETYYIHAIIPKEQILKSHISYRIAYTKKQFWGLF